MPVIEIFKSAIGAHAKFKERATSHPLLLTLLGIVLMVFGAFTAFATSSFAIGHLNTPEIVKQMVDKIPADLQPILNPTALMTAAAVPTTTLGVSMLFAVLASIVDRGPNLSKPSPHSEVTPPPPPELDLHLQQEISLRKDWEAYALSKDDEARRHYERKEEYKVQFLNERAWRRITLRAPFVSITLAFLYLIASWMYPMTGHPVGSWLYPMETAFHNLGALTQEQWHGIVGLVLTLAFGVVLGGYYSRDKFRMVTELKRSVVTHNEYPMRIPFLEIGAIVALSALVVNLAYLLISCGYQRFYVEDAAGSAGTVMRDFDSLSLVVLYRILALPAAAVLGTLLGAWLRPSPQKTMAPV